MSSDPDADPRTKFDVDRKNEAPYDRACRFYRTVPNTGRFFRKGATSIWYMINGRPPALIRDIDHFRGISESFFDFTRVVRHPTGDVDVSTHLRRDEASSIFHSAAVQLLPELKHVISDPCVIQNGTGFKITPVGFDPSSEILYYIPPGGTAIKPRDSTAVLEECFSGVPFEKPEYRNNLIAWLLGGVVLNSNLLSPMLVFSGNQQNIGKTVTMEAAGYILTGRCCSSVSAALEEFEKQVGARFAKGERFIALDNAEGKNGVYHNGRLAAFITQPDSTDIRILGRSEFVRQSDVLYTLTANHCRLSADLVTRSLPIKLYREDPGPISPFVLKYAEQYRRELYAELLGLALYQTDEDYSQKYPRFRFRSWLNFVGPRIEKKFGPLAIDESIEISGAVIEVFKYLREQGEFSFTSRELMTHIRNNPHQFHELYAQLQPFPSQLQAVQLGKFLSRYCATKFHHLGEIMQLTKKDPPAKSKHGFVYKLDLIKSQAEVEVENGNPA